MKMGYPFFEMSSDEKAKQEIEQIAKEFLGDL